MDEKRVSSMVKIIICAIIGLLSALAVRNVLIGIGIMLALFISWAMWEYIKDTTATK